MKKTIIILLAAFVYSSCQKKLNESIKSSLTPSFFQTQQGFLAGLNAAYAGNRNDYGPETGVFAFTIPGTDEFRIANGTRTAAVNNYSSSYNSANEFSQDNWNNCYTMINTCNGLVDYGAAITGISDASKTEMIAEAKFLRANYYFRLVQFFGDVTLNQHFLSNPTTAAIRTSKADVYNFIIQDLKDASVGLPASPQTTGVLPGKATAAAARHLLSKVYLTRGWSSAAQPDDFSNAFTTATALINDAPSIGIGLLPDFASVFTPKNENNKESLFTVQYSADQTYGGPNNNIMNHFFVTNYTTVPCIVRNYTDGRPYNWIRGTKWLYDTAFADKVDDTRYYKSFQQVWHVTTAGTYTFHGVSYHVNVGDTAIFMPGYDVADAVISSKPYQLMPPRTYTAYLYPTMTKFLDPNRTINVNQNSTRPLIIYRLAETYLIAAEAALMMGQPANAVPYVNAIRARAAFNGGNAAAMTVTTGDITLDFILDERTRELCGEQMRWPDLVRTQKLLERVQKHDDYQAYLNIIPKDTLRPIPLTQIDAVITGTPYPQNPGW